MPVPYCLLLQNLGAKVLFSIQIKKHFITGHKKILTTGNRSNDLSLSVINLSLMKSIALVTVFMIIAAQTVKAQPLARTADEILKEAYQQAARENKNVFVIFHASWCGWCHKMDKSMSDTACKVFFDNNYVITHLVVAESKDKKNLENPGADELLKKYYGDGQGIPYWLIFDKEGKLLADSKLRTSGAGLEAGDNTGCPASEKEVAYFVDILKKTSKLTAQQLEIIRKRFRENE
jgi:thioredoxin-related protein